ncbi:dolichyldiphosphatase 1-like isoform X2 [Macrobrachium rosenbergii]|uniref:dolichyldiphosphatase 1-like isoform X2 n=1 Tax=Macrobrachium rosenbergii TaxID=79674 RepID=UPI0034D73BB4
MSDVKWKAFSLTHVEYPEGDRIGQLLAISSLTPLAIIVGFVTLILFRRDLHTIVFFAGALLNEAVNLVMKRIIAEPRPLTRKGLYTEHGMPSSHSQMMWFFSSYSILFLIFRVYLLYHTWSQIIWGAVIGVMLGVSWFSFTHLVLSPFFPTVASWRISERLMIRDTSLIPNIMWFEYTHARTENRARSRKLTSMKSQ